MKKVLAFVSSLLLVAAAAFADVSVKKLDDGNVEVTFFYANPRAGEVYVAGDFTNWGDGALPMTKSDKGFTLVHVVPAGTVMKYKFISDGNWTEDMHEPDKVDDGFGGHNGLVDVDELLAAGSSATASSAESSAPVASSKKASIKFATWSMIGAENKWDITDGKLKEKSAGVGAKSYWKLSGNITPHIPFYAELAVADNTGFDNIYNETNEEWLKNLGTLGLNLLTNPIATLNGGSTSLGHFKMGFESPYVNVISGYKYAKVSPHNSAIWNTVCDSWDAGWSENGGFVQASLGNAVKEAVADLTDGAVSDLEVVLVPNKTADRKGDQYGMIAIVDATLFGDHYVDFQYNGAYGTDTLTALDPKNIMESDFIVGYRGNIGDVTVKANALMNFYGNYVHDNGKIGLYVPADSDVGAVFAFPFYSLNNVAAAVNVLYSNDIIDLNAGYKFRGSQANLMYNRNVADVLGGRDKQTVYADVTVYPLDVLTTSLSASVTTPFLGWDESKNVVISARPSAELYLGDYIDLDSAVDAYASMSFETEGTKFNFGQAGIHFGATLDNDIVPNIDVYYGYDSLGDKKVNHSLIATADLPWGINAQAGCVLRTDSLKLTSDPFGFFIGANKVINSQYKTILYTQFVYNMEAYKGFGDGQEALNLNGYTLDNDSTGYAAARVALRFEF